MTAQREPKRGIQVFLIIWFGQLISTIGSSLTGFALGVWVYQETGSATLFALISLSMVLPFVLISPIAGVVADRWDRRWLLIVSDLGEGLVTFALAMLLWSDLLMIWQIYVLMAIRSSMNALRWPAAVSVTPLLVPKSQLARANGLTQLSLAISQIVPPVIAGVLLVTIQIWGVILIDAITFLFSIVSLLLIRIPRPEPGAEAASANRGSLFRQATYGWTYIRGRAGLLGLLIFFAMINFLMSLLIVLVTPLVLDFASAAVLGVISSISGVGMLAGSILMSVWGGPRRRIYGVLGFMLLCGVCMALAGLRPSVVLLTVAGFGFFFAIPVINGCTQVIWQSKVPPAIQGRVFAMRGMIATSAGPLAYLLAGPLADRVFRPLLVEGGPLAASLGPVLGVGESRGIGLMFILGGALTILVTIGGALSPRIWRVEDELPDALPDDVPADQARSAPNYTEVTRPATDLPPHS